MQRRINFGMVILLIQLFTWSVWAQDDKLAGRWEGKTSSPQGERDTVASFKKEGGSLTGTITGMRGDMQLKDIKVDGNKVTAKAEVDTGQATLTINYSFVLDGDALKGKGALDFNGNPFEFEVALQRAGGSAAAPANNAAAAPARAAGAPQAAGAAAPRPNRASVAQPQQKQSLEYFVGAWNFNYRGRDSALGLGVREGVVTFTKSADGKSVTGQVIGKNDNGAYKESVTISFDETTKAFVTTEKLASGPTVNLKGDWSSPIAIRMANDPLKIKGQTLKLRRTLNIIAAHSFSILDELSEDDGPFVRLGNAVFAKVEAK